MHVLISGASQGIGAAIARAFAAEPGARLSLVARRRGALEAVAAGCAEAGAECFVLPCDLTAESQVEACVSAALAAGGAPDVLVNNAGRFRPGDLAATDGAAFRLQLEENLVSAFLLTRSLLPSMRERRRGHVFFMASVAALQAYPNALAYTAAKHGVLGLARAVRAETLESGLRVTTVLPGATRTPSWDGVDVPEERLMPADDVARAIVECWRLGERTVVEELLLRPRRGDL